MKVKIVAKHVHTDYNAEEYEAKYDEIALLYDLADDLLSTVESPLVSDPEAQLDVIEPLISEIGDAADVLSQEFICIAESKKTKAPMKASKTMIESGLRKLFAAVNDYQNRVRDINKQAHGSIMNIADPIIQKIQRQIEKVMVIFFEHINISLQSLMGKAELEALKGRDSRIALMMHEQSMVQQQG